MLTLKVLTITEVIIEYAGVSMDLQVPLLIIDLRGVSIMSALFVNRRVTHLRVAGHHLGAHMFQTKGLQSAGNVSIETGIVSIETELFRVKLQKVVMHVILKCCKGFM